MNQEEAEAYSLTIPWKTEVCHVGEDCWCRVVVPIEEIKYTYNVNPHGDIVEKREDTLDVIIPDGSVDKTTAEYIVRIHNEKLGFKKDV